MSAIGVEGWGKKQHDEFIGRVKGSQRCSLGGKRQQEVCREVWEAAGSPSGSKRLVKGSKSWEELWEAERSTRKGIWEVHG